mgnify:CR=1 FL=1
MSLNATLLGQMITFAIFVLFTMKVIWPILEKTLEERKIKIALGLEAAEKGHKKLLEAEVTIEGNLLEAKKQKEEILIQATKTASKIIEEAKEFAKLEKEKIIVSGYREIEQATLKVKNELKEQVIALVVSGVEKILKKEISSDTHKDILITLSKAL